MLSINFHPKTILLTALALIAFAANSVLCRLALGSDAIDAANFTAIRLLSGTIVLLGIIRFSGSTKTQASKGSWLASIMLFIYAVAFSYAYFSLDTGTGALILFGTVQITMIALSIFSGTRLHFSEWLGVVVAFSGFVYLVLPGATAPSMLGFVLMASAGIAWGLYTLIGRSSKNPLMDTASNFCRTTPLAVLLVLFGFSNANITPEGVALALVSGGITSGIGYTIWYIALRDLSSLQAAVLQLLVPALAVLGGVIFVSEPITPRLLVSSAMILGGIMLVVLGKHYLTSVKNA